MLKQRGDALQAGSGRFGTREVLMNFIKNLLRLGVVNSQRSSRTFKLWIYYKMQNLEKFLIIKIVRIIMALNKLLKKDVKQIKKGAEDLLHS